MKRETDRFRTNGDDGRPYTVFVLHEIIATHPADGGAGETWGVPAYRTDTGSHVKRLDRVRYQVIVSGVVLTPVEPPPV